MERIRWGQCHKQQTENNLYRFENKPDDEKFMQATFREFGYGERRGTFSVRVKWEDIETYIRQFARMKHPEALRLQSALRLANKVEEAGYHSENSPRSN